jgi:hypothetical protein
MKIFLFTLTLLFVFKSTPAQADELVLSVQNAQKLIKENHADEVKRLKQQIKESDSVDPESYSEEFKKQNFKIYTLIGKVLIRNKKALPEDHKTRKLFLSYREKLSQLEYKELKVEKIYDLIQLHFKQIEDKQFHGHWRFFLDYVSWQYSAVLNKPTGSSDLIITNKGFCPGMSYARENKYFSFSADACYLQTSGGVSSIDPTVTYTQSNISATGIKSSLAASYFVSSSRAEIGLKVPFLLVSQDLEDPPAVGYKVKEGTSLIPMVGLYSRWPLGQYFFQTEFAKYFSEDQTQWALGIGYKF